VDLSKQKLKERLPQSHPENLSVLPGEALVVSDPALEITLQRDGFCSVLGSAQVLCLLNFKGEIPVIQKKTGFVMNPTR